MNNQETTYDFQDGYGPVPAYRHRNPDGSIGGWVADTASVDDTAYISENAKVFGTAQVFENARVSGNAQVFGNAEVFGTAHVYGNAQVFGHSTETITLIAEQDPVTKEWIYFDEED